MGQPGLWTVRLGDATAPPDRIPLRAGPLRLVFEDGELRYIRLGDREVIRRIYATVRDAAWNTFPARIAIRAQEIREDSFAITFQAEHRGAIEGGGEVQVTSVVSAVGTADGSLRFSMSGRAHLPFLSNRAGICVLHPTPAVLGSAVTIEHVDGSLEEGVFPRLISETLPFTDIRSVTYHAADGHRVRVRCVGAVFEMEDQRNYGDASFKTFSTPLRLPKPVQITPETRLSQAVVVDIQGAAVPAVEPPARVTVALGAETGRRMPRVGFGHQGAVLSTPQLALVRALAPSHLHVELGLAQPGWQALLAGTAAQAVRLGCAVEICVLAVEEPATEDALQALAALVRRLAIAVSAFVVCSPKIFPAPGLLQLARRILPASSPGALLAGGSWSGYCLVNERRPDFASLDGVAFECNPQGHAKDPSTVMENLPALVDSIASLRAMCGTAEVLISPLRFIPREGEAANSPRRAVDPRLTALFGAAWSCGALASLLAEPPDALSAFELLGATGLLNADPAAAAGLQAHPLYHVFADLAEGAAGRIRATRVDQPLRVAAWSVAATGRTRMQISNLESEITPLAVHGLEGPLRIRCLDEVSAAEAMADPARWRATWSSRSLAPGAQLHLELLPYAVCLIESAGAATTGAP